MEKVHGILLATLLEIYVVDFGVDNSLPSHTDNRKNNILVLGEGLAGAINDSTGAAEAKSRINVSKGNTKFIQHFFLVFIPPFALYLLSGFDLFNRKNPPAPSPTYLIYDPLYPSS